MKQRPLILVLLMLMFCYLAGALVAYPLYNTFSAPDIGNFHKYARYATLFFGLIGSWLLLKYSQEHTRTNHVIIKNNPLLNITSGLLLGCVLFLIIESVLISLGVRKLSAEHNLGATYILIVIAKGLLTGLVVAVLEEVLFRRNIFTILSGQHSFCLVMFFSSGIYAAVHFIDFPELSEPIQIEWFTAVQLLPQTMSGLIDTSIWDTFLTLFFLGCLLAIFRARYNTIYYCIGIHAGVVMGVKLSRKLTDYNPETTLGFLVNSTDRQQGLVASLILLAACCFCYWWLFIRQQAHHERFP